MDLIRAINLISQKVLPVLNPTQASARNLWHEDWHDLRKDLKSPHSLIARGNRDVAGNKEMEPWQQQGRPALELLGPAHQDSSSVGLVWRALANGRFPVEVLCVPDKGRNAEGLHAWAVASSSPSYVISPMLHRWTETLQQVRTDWNIGSKEKTYFDQLPESCEVFFALRPLPYESVRWWWAELVAKAIKEQDVSILRHSLNAVIRQV